MPYRKNPNSEAICKLVKDSPPHTVTVKDLRRKFPLNSEDSIRGILRVAGLSTWIKPMPKGPSPFKKEEPMVRKTKAEISDAARLESQVRAGKKEKREIDRKYTALQDELHETQKALKAALGIMKREPKPFQIKEKKSHGGQQTAFALLSDVHCEELVPAHKVNYLNEHNPEISKRRVARFFQLVVKFIQMNRTRSPVDNLVLWLGGDFFTNDMHGAPTAFPPGDAMRFAEDMLIGGIEYLVDREPDLKIHIVGSVGNHSRMQVAKMVNVALEQELSLEWIMYHHLKALFKDNGNITFQLDNSFHSYVECYGWNIRFNHGHQGFRYNKGQAGLHGPLFKAISEVWDKQVRADLTCIGHYHTYTPGATLKSRSYIVNGSTIGAAPYGMTIGYEDPCQAFFLIHNRYGLCGQQPLYVDL